MKSLFTLTALFSILSFQLSFGQKNGIGIGSTEYYFYRNEIGVNSPSFAKTEGINGGNYVSLGYSFYILERMSLGASFAADLVPNTFNDLIGDVNAKLYSGVSSTNFQANIGFFYKYNFSSTALSTNFTGARIAILNYVEEDIRVEFLPVYLLYSIENSDFSFGYEFVSLGFRF